MVASRTPSVLARVGWALLAVLSGASAVLLFSSRVYSCPSGGDCQSDIVGGPVGWAVFVGLVVLTAYLVRRAVRPSRERAAAAARHRWKPPR